MRAEIEAAERRTEVRRAARSWAEQGAIPREIAARVEETYPDDRARVGPVFRVLLFAFTVIAVFSTLGLLALVDESWGVLFPIMSIGCLTVTEVQTGRYRRSASGAEEATACLAVVFFLAAAAWMLVETTGEVDFPWRVWALSAAAAWALAAWRWGSWPYGALAAIGLLVMSAFLPATRIYWFLTAVVLVPILLRFSLSERTAPSHRRACDAALLVLLAAVYLTVHLGAYDARLLEDTTWFGSGGLPIPRPGRWFFIAGTTLVPLLLLAAGVFWRLPIFFRTAVVLAVVSLVTLRFYVHVAPLWVVLTVSGAAAIVVALFLRRYLETGSGRERYGFTAEPLYENLSRMRALEMGIAVGLGPGAPQQPDAPSFRGGGGEFGGGGASDTY